MFVYFCGKIVDKRAYLPTYLSSSALSAYLRVIKMKVNKQQNKNPAIIRIFLLFSSNSVHKGRKQREIVSFQFLAYIALMQTPCFLWNKKCLFQSVWELCLLNMKGY
jgi:hypothetical protein